ncbi:hypothetical protein SAMN06273572_1169 [Monaibacterium marinum]|uniref:Uncharacterized protein n=1 Tax=Pontivivens marinum TaxID=1690039 RepID=A0A2C9CWP6_9RHOB|nr:hypothetical protein [Monaibacterium marinum]SOH95687.1 hypothetical protein SAMN06273572_1169 [Monaibacterium marinum]
MADTPNTMSTVGTEPLIALLAEDRLAFRNALDAIFRALRADWLMHEARKILDTDVGQNRIHDSATAWCECMNALSAVLDIDGANADLKSAAQAFLNVTNEFFPDTTHLLECGSTILELHRKNKQSNPGHAELLYEAYALTEAYRGNLDLMAVHRRLN